MFEDDEGEMLTKEEKKRLEKFEKKKKEKGRSNNYGNYSNNYGNNYGKQDANRVDGRFNEANAVCFKCQKVSLKIRFILCILNKYL